MSTKTLFEELQTKLKDDHFAIKEFEPSPTVEITSFLGRLSMLNGVPPQYLVPDEKLLIKYRDAKDKDGKAVITENGKIQQEECGALRFFWIDPVWIESLLDGALSMGAKSDTDLLLTKAMAGNYLAEEFNKALTQRLKKQLGGSYSPDDFKNEMDKRFQEKAVKPNPTNAENSWRFTGFLMRSSLVSGWAGLEVEARGQDSFDENIESLQTLPLLRMERIATDTIFCLCEGIIRELVITQPPEDLHFAVNLRQDSTSFYKELTDIQSLMKNENGDAQETNKEIDVHFRNENNIKRVINIVDLAKEMGKKLDTKNLTSAEFAMEMVSRPIRNMIKVNWK